METTWAAFFPFAWTQRAAEPQGEMRTVRISQRAKASVRLIYQFMEATPYTDPGMRGQSSSTFCIPSYVWTSSV